MKSELAEEVQRRLDFLTKPQGSLGRLEELALRYALIRGSAMPDLRRKSLFIFCADHGVTEEGVSAYPSDITRLMVRNFVSGGAAINVLCRHADIEAVVVDVGVKGPAEPGALDRKMAEGTGNFAREPAMTRAQAEQAIETGRALAKEAAASGCDALATGEMGIGNTTAAAALFSVFSGLDAAETAGRGAGLDDAGVARKAEVIRRALAMHRPDPDDPIGALAAVGGFEIGAMAGLLLGGAEAHVPVALDGFISCSAALVARAIDPGAMDAALFAHRSAERAHARMLAFLEAEPYLDLGMRLGEGTGAALLLWLLEAAVKLYREMATFDSLQ